ncbi:MAG: hypothetical protein EOM22_07565 [Gammaproteobacteria bacterium]|nr:hypothetical protein [Gammaproteobacteria bacterium]
MKAIIHRADDDQDSCANEQEKSVRRQRKPPQGARQDAAVNRDPPDDRDRHCMAFASLVGSVNQTNTIGK